MNEEVKQVNIFKQERGISEIKPESINDYLIECYKRIKLMSGQSLKDDLNQLSTFTLSKTIYDDLNSIAGVDKKGRLKKFKLKSNIKRKLKNMAKKNKLLVLLLKNNRSIVPTILDLNSGYILVDGVPRKCTMDYIYLWDNKSPCIVMPEWDLEPIGTKEYYEKNPKGLPKPDALKMVLAIRESSDVKTKKDMNVGKFVLIGLGIIVAIYIFMGGF